MAYKKLKLWFDKELAQMLAKKIRPLRPGFAARRFVNAIDKGVGPLELKDRVELIADELHQQLGPDYPANIELMLQILGPENEQETGMFTNYYWIMPLAKYVEKYGLEHFELSMQAIMEITKRNTGEYTIRPYLERYSNATLKAMLEWAQHPNKHVRRLASEGGRSRLPWAPKLQQFIDDPRPLRPILEQLKDDPSKYVQKSVANCLNDIFKDHPDLGRQWIEEWAVKPGKERRWIIKHALRKLIKQEVPWALELIRPAN